MRSDGTRHRRIRLPPGRHFALTWSIPDDFGGMTEALLRRSRAFRTLAGTPVDVLTFDDRPDYAELASGLHARGVLTDGVRIVNLYDWLRDNALPLDGVRSADIVADERVPRDAEHPIRTPGGRARAFVRRDPDGRVLQIDHVRDDGTLLLTDRRDAPAAGGRARRRVVLYDEAERPIRSWHRIRDLYAAWLDALTGQQPSFMIVDSKTVARFMITYRRPHVVTAHVVHASHRDTDGRLRASRREVLARAHRFDVVTVLSAAQARDLRDRLGRLPNLTVIPNCRGDHRPPGSLTRPRQSGVVVSALTRRKRVSHAIDAVRRAGAGSGRAIRLDVYGDGPSRQSLERRASGDPRIRFHGHVAGASAHLGSASFLLLTSHTEGYPLALIEAMAAGCVPISYDIEYGPADIIRHGRNGYLVAPADVDGLARTITDFVALPERKARAMRARAIRSTLAFSDDRVCRQWADVLQDALIRRSLRENRILRPAVERWPVLRRATGPAVLVVRRTRSLMAQT